MLVTSLPVSRPKSSSPASGGIRLKPSRRRNTVTGLSTRCRCLVCGISGRNASSVAVCSHQFTRADVVVFVEREPDEIRHHQHEDEQRDDARFRRDLAQPLGPHHEAADARPAIDTATATANTATKPK